MFVKFIKEFKIFIARGNVIDMAVGVIVGAAFTGVVNSLVQGVVMPALGLLVAGIDFSDMKIVLKAAAGDAPEVAILYGSFIQTVISFIVMAFVVFLLVKVINKIRGKKEEKPAAPPATSKELETLIEIRDLLKEKKAAEQ